MAELAKKSSGKAGTSVKLYEIEAGSDNIEDTRVVSHKWVVQALIKVPMRDDSDEYTTKDKIASLKILLLNIFFTNLGKLGLANPPYKTRKVLNTVLKILLLCKV